jgi:hypothetical protein
MPSFFASKGPLNGNSVVIHAAIPSSNFFPQGSSICNSSLTQALPRKQTDLDFRLIQPTGMLGSVVHGEDRVKNYVRIVIKIKVDAADF